jgi:hypothetical protein
MLPAKFPTQGEETIPVNGAAGRSFRALRARFQVKEVKEVRR